MPETIRIGGGYARPRHGGFLAAGRFAAGLSMTVAASGRRPRAPKNSLCARCKNSRSAPIATSIVTSLRSWCRCSGSSCLPPSPRSCCCARARARRALEAAARDEIAALRDRLDRAHALILSERQVLVDWPAASDLPNIEGDPEILGVNEPHRALAFGSWLDAGKAAEMERAVEALRARGEAFAMTLTTLAGQPIEAQGRAIGGRAVLRLKDASAVTRELVAAQRPSREIARRDRFAAHADRNAAVAGVDARRGRTAHLRQLRLCARGRSQGRDRRHRAEPGIARQLRARDHRAGAQQRRRSLFGPAARGRRRRAAQLRRARNSHRHRQRRHRHRRHRSGNHAQRAGAHGRCAPAHARSTADRRRHVRCRSADSRSTMPPIARCGISTPPCSISGRPIRR